jgi:branched-chain amino acid transport system ATP-binding protein
MSVLDNMLVAAACGERRLSFFESAHTREKIDASTRLLHSFGLAGHAQRRVGELPGGVRKLLDIALAMSGRPKLLLLDEPTSGVSVEEKFPLMDTVMSALGGETVLFVEHDMDIVTRYASRVIAFYSGRVLADGAPGAVLADEDVRRHVTGHG